MKGANVRPGGTAPRQAFTRTATTRSGTETEISLETVNEIGTGAFGKVNKMKIKETTRASGSKVVAVKNPTKETRTRLDVMEKDLLVNLKHKNIIDILYSYQVNKSS